MTCLELPPKSSARQTHGETRLDALCWPWSCKACLSLIPFPEKQRSLKTNERKQRAQEATVAAVAMSMYPSRVWVLSSYAGTPVDAPSYRGGQMEELKVTWSKEESCVKRLKID